MVLLTAFHASWDSNIWEMVVSRHIGLPKNSSSRLFALTNLWYTAGLHIHFDIQDRRKNYHVQGDTRTAVIDWWKRFVAILRTEVIPVNLSQSAVSMSWGGRSAKYSSEVVLPTKPHHSYLIPWKLGWLSAKICPRRIPGLVPLDPVYYGWPLCRSFKVVVPMSRVLVGSSVELHCTIRHRTPKFQ